VTISPSLSTISNSIGLAQLQTFFETVVEFERVISNLQFIYPSNFPPATVDVSTPTRPFFTKTIPVENSNAQLSVNIISELVVQVSAFSQVVNLTVTHDLGFDLVMQATPADTGNDEDVCVQIINSFSINVANSGPFFQALGGANSLSVFQEQNTLLSSCQTVALGPSPLSSRLTRSSLYARDSFTCAPLAAVPPAAVAFQGTFP